MEIKILKNEKQVAQKAADFIQEEIRKKSNLVLGLSSGDTVIPLYKELIKRKINFSQVRVFSLDEYLDAKEKQTFRKFLEKHLLNKINVKKKNIHLLKECDDINGECQNYEQEIKSVGGIDLQILGIGRNAHIAFNEPGSPFKSKTRKIELTRQTRLINRKYHPGMKVPKFALTMGLQTIFKSKKILLLATTKYKANAIYKTLKEKVSTKIPASVLRKHKRVTIMLDQAAAKLI